MRIKLLIWTVETIWLYKRCSAHISSGPAERPRFSSRQTRSTSSTVSILSMSTVSCQHCHQCNERNKKIAESLSGREITHAQNRNPQTDLDKILYGGRYPRRSYLHKFWWPSVKGFLGGGGQIFPSPIDFHRRPYNTLALPCERVIGIVLEVKSLQVIVLKVGHICKDVTTPVHILALYMLKHICWHQ